MIGTCATVGVIAWRSGIFDSPPELPAFGRPLNAEELSNTEVSCDIRDDFVGPRVREIVFGTQHRPTSSYRHWPSDIAHEVGT
jgi:hypothetical protein